MLKYIIKRLLLALLTIFIVISILFVIIHSNPKKMYDKERMDWTLGVFNVNNDILYHDPLPKQFFNYWKGVITRFDLGLCTTRGPKYDWVTHYIARSVKITLFTHICVILFSFLGIPLGILAACNRNKWIDYVINAFGMLLYSIPIIVAAYAFQYYIGFKAGIFPIIYPYGLKEVSLESLHGLSLPILSLSMAPMGMYIRSTYVGLTETLTSDHMLLARVKGLTNWQAIKRHAIRNSLIAVLPDMYSNIAFITINSIIIELIYVIPGAGINWLRSYFNSDYVKYLFTDYGVNGEIYEIMSRPTDYNVFLGYSMFFTGLAVILGLLLDISYGIIDPRIRIGTDKTNNY